MSLNDTELPKGLRRPESFEWKIGNRGLYSVGGCMGDVEGYLRYAVP